MKVALLLYGQPRGVDKKDVWLSHKQFVLDKYDTDVYAHMWYSDLNTTYEISSHAMNSSSVIIPNSDIIIENRYNPKRLLVEKPRQFDVAAYKAAFESTGKYKCSENFPNYISQLYSVEQVAKLCIESGIQYDKIIIARYDVVIDSFPEIEDLNPKFFYTIDHHPLFPDLFYIFSYIHLETQLVYTNLLERIQRNIESIFVWEPSAECMKFLKYIEVSDIKNIRSIEIKEHRV